MPRSNDEIVAAGRDELTDTALLEWLAAHSTVYGSAIEMDHGVWLDGPDLRAAIRRAIEFEGIHRAHRR